MRKLRVFKACGGCSSFQRAWAGRCSRNPQSRRNSCACVRCAGHLHRAAQSKTCSRIQCDASQSMSLSRHEVRSYVGGVVASALQLDLRPRTGRAAGATTAGGKGHRAPGLPGLYASTCVLSISLLSVSQWKRLMAVAVAVAKVLFPLIRPPVSHAHVREWCGRKGFRALRLCVKASSTRSGGVRPARQLRRHILETSARLARVGVRGLRSEFFAIGSELRARRLSMMLCGRPTRALVMFCGCYSKQSR